MSIANQARPSRCDQLAAKISDYFVAKDARQLRELLTSAGRKRFRSQGRAEYIALRCLIALGLTKLKIDAAFVVLKLRGAWTFRIGFCDQKGHWN